MRFSTGSCSDQPAHLQRLARTLNVTTKLLREQITKVLIRLRSWSEPLLFAYNYVIFSLIEAHMLWNNAGLQIYKKLGRKIVNIFLSISLNICFGCSKEPSHWDGAFEHPKHMFWLRNKKNNFWLHSLNWRPGNMRWRILIENQFNQSDLAFQTVS